ncbi:uncharacterized protein LY79DRAFT_551135 [Colletotrichum navitas]|uniref:Uncharacterized protein n=1 Tax=Colletotrichum navitas TaxID=681940 RepID=A0AAD8V5M0_9PEZI|nr:uncharacterized protein LY79DRAFT_551135 [Colletotrichum navitas]KAK1593869.1 hypothetical protein LY79DRAFT_551135 [Colletotrichum navitas]
MGSPAGKRVRRGGSGRVFFLGFPMVLMAPMIPCLDVRGLLVVAVGSVRRRPGGSVPLACYTHSGACQLTVFSPLPQSCKPLPYVLPSDDPLRFFFRTMSSRICFLCCLPYNG